MISQLALLTRSIRQGDIFNITGHTQTLLRERSRGRKLDMRRPGVLIPSLREAQRRRKPDMRRPGIGTPLHDEHNEGFLVLLKN